MLGGRRSKTWNVPLYRVDEKGDTLRVRPSLEDKDWDEILAAMMERGITGLDAGGQLTDRVLARLGQLGHLTRLNFGGTKRITDDGLRHMARLSRLQELDLSDYPGGQITDRGLEVLADLRELRRFQMCWQRGITDVGVAHLRTCDHLESVDLMGTFTGDGAIAALAAKRRLHRL